jgi:hypothetical protein
MRYDMTKMQVHGLLADRNRAAVLLLRGDEIVYADQLVFRQEYEPNFARIGLCDPINPRLGVVLANRPSRHMVHVAVTAIWCIRAPDLWTSHQPKDLSGTQCEWVKYQNIVTPTERSLVWSDRKQRWRQIEGDNYLADITTSRGPLDLTARHQREHHATLDEDEIDNEEEQYDDE